MLARIAVASKGLSLGSALLENIIRYVSSDGVREFIIMPVNDSRGFYYKFAQKRPRLVSVSAVGLGMVKYVTVASSSNFASSYFWAGIWRRQDG